MTLTLHSLTRAACLFAAMSTLAACPGGKSETDSATDGTTEQTTGTTTSDVPTTSEATVSPTSSVSTTTEAMPGTTGTSAATEGTTIEVETTTASTEGTTTDDPIPEELGVACLAACSKFFECIPQPPFPDPDACAAECASALGMGPTCLEDTVAFNSCIGEMSCDELLDAYVNEEFGPCEDEFVAMGQGCEVCEGLGSAGPDACSTGQKCSGQPKQELSCEGDTCTCLVDDQVVNDCPAPAAICDGDEGDLAMVALDCCGFEF